MPDVRKTLQVLHDEWSGCHKCQLGINRRATRGAFVFGEGSRRGVLFVGEGPGWQEEAQGRPFVGKSGMILRTMLDMLGLKEHYITNLVACRSCEQMFNEDGTPLMRDRRRGPPVPAYKDVPPTPPQWKLCLERLHEQIYIIDPIVIVSLGVTAAEALAGHSVTILRDRGKELTIEIPGAGVVPVLTEKKGAWYRKVKGEVVAPVEQNMVRYTMVPTLHPAYVAREHMDRGTNNPFSLLLDDIRRAVKIYEFYLQEVLNIQPSGQSDVTYEEVYQRWYTENEMDPNQ